MKIWNKFLGRVGFLSQKWFFYLAGNWKTTRTIVHILGQNILATWGNFGNIPSSFFLSLSQWNLNWYIFNLGSPSNKSTKFYAKKFWRWREIAKLKCPKLPHLYEVTLADGRRDITFYLIYIFFFFLDFYFPPKAEKYIIGLSDSQSVCHKKPWRISELLGSHMLQLFLVIVPGRDFGFWTSKFFRSSIFNFGFDFFWLFFWIYFYIIF